MLNKKQIAEITFWIHLPITLLLFGLFFIPISIWQGVIIFHFWYTWTIIIIQLIWGLYFIPHTKKLDIICPLTTLTQSLRGYPKNKKENYAHSFNAELLRRLGIKVSYEFVNWIMILTVILVTIQYLLI